MPDLSDELEIIDRIYAIAMEPERFIELVDLWHDKLLAAGVEGYKIHPSENNRLYGHIQRADTILSLVTDNEDILPTPLQEKLNSVSRPMMAFDKSGNISALNPAAEKMYGLSAGQDLGDFISDPVGQNRIRRVIRTLLIKAQPGPFQPLLFRVQRSEGSKQILASMHHWKTAGARKFALLQTSNFVWPTALDDIMAEAFDLTEAETDVIKQIVEGATLQEVTDIRGSTLATVRSQVKSIYSKTGTNSQNEFMRMALGLVSMNLQNQYSDGPAGADTRPNTTHAFPLPEHQRLLTLKDGRLLEYAEFGPRDGKPCLYFHSDFSGNVWPERLARTAISSGLRIIIPSRPYYGRSSPYPDNVIHYEQTANDLIALLNYLKVDKAVCVSITFGGMYAMALSDKYPDRIAGHVAIAPSFSVSSTKEENDMPKIYKFMNSIITRHPKLFETVVKLALACHNRIGSIRYLKTVLRDIPADMAVLEDDSNLEAIVKGFEFNTANGHKAIFNDYRHILHDTPELLSALLFPIFAIIGDSDKNSRLARTNRVIKSGVKIEKVMAKNGGTLLLFTHPELIVKTLQDAWNWHS